MSDVDVQTFSLLDAGAIGMLLNGTLAPATMEGLVHIMDSVGNGNRGDGENLLWQQQVCTSR